MIRYLTGTVRFKELSAACLDVAGVGYHVNMPVGDLARLGAIGEKAEVFVHTRVREDAIDLYGFANAEGLSLFEMLLGVNGVGPRMGLALLSGLEPQDLYGAVQGGDEARLVKVPGVGKKTAARIVLELRDKLKGLGAGGPVMAPGPNDVMGDVRSALTNLGYKANQIDKAIRALDKKQADGASLDLQQLVVEALKHV